MINENAEDAGEAWLEVRFAATVPNWPKIYSKPRAAITQPEEQRQSGHERAALLLGRQRQDQELRTQDKERETGSLMAESQSGQKIVHIATVESIGTRH